MANATTLLHRYFPESAIGGFSRVDGALEFWSRVRAIIQPDWHVLDYGAGRGASIGDEPSPYIQKLKKLRGDVARIEGCDVDPAVMDNPFLDAAAIIDFAAPLPYPDASFDLVYANWVFEHVEQPEHFAAELLRVTKPGGWIAAATANRWGYVAIAASLVPNRHHVAAKARISPDVPARDIFPTRYRMNTPSRLKSLFGGEADVTTYTQSAEPAYHGNSPLIYPAFLALHKLLPRAFATGLYMFAQKRGAA